MAQYPDLILDCAEENKCLALACLHVACRNLSLDVIGVAELLRQSNGLLYYTHQYWFEYLEGAGGNCIPNLKILADAMKVAYARLQRYAQEMLSVNKEALALIGHLRDTAIFASRCINSNLDGTSFCSSRG